MKPRELIGESPEAVKGALALLAIWDDDPGAAQRELIRIDNYTGFIRAMCFLNNMLLGIKFGKHALSNTPAPTPVFPMIELYNLTREALSPEVEGYETCCNSLKLLELSLGNKSSFFLRLYSIEDPAEEIASLADFFYSLAESEYGDVTDHLDYIEFYMEDWLSGIQGMPEPY